MKELDRTFHRSFKKVRITNKSKAPTDDVQILLKLKLKINTFLKDAKSKFMKNYFTKHKQNIENKLSEIISQ